MKPLEAAVREGNLTVVKRLIKENVEIEIDNKNWVGDTALLLASFHGFTEIVKVLLEAGATIDLQDCNGYTAIELASKRGHNNTVNCLKKEINIK